MNSMNTSVNTSLNTSTNIIDRIKKRQLIEWLSIDIGNNKIMYDCVLDIMDTILEHLEIHSLTLKYEYDHFLINLIHFLYNNSFIN